MCAQTLIRNGAVCVRQVTFDGAVWLGPDYKRCLILLAPGGGEAVEVREFDAEKFAFVAGGFDEAREAS